MSQQVRWDYISNHVLPSSASASLLSSSSSPSSSSSSSSAASTSAATPSVSPIPSPLSLEKAVYDALIHPTTYMKSDRDFQAAMKLLSCLYESLISRLLSCYYSPRCAVIPVHTASTDTTASGVPIEGPSPEASITSATSAAKEKDEERDNHHETINNEEQQIVTTLLIDMKRNLAQKLYRFAVSAGGKGRNQPPKEEWKAAYTKEDIAFIVKTDPFDAIQRLVLSSGF